MPVLAQSNNGKFDTKNIPSGVNLWVQFAKNQIKDIIKADIPVHPIAEKEWRKYLSGELNIPTNKNSRIASNNCYEWYAYGQYQCKAPPRQVVSPLTSPKCEWGQGGLSTYYLSGDLGGGQVTSCTSCNKFNAGCGPVAIAQIARFYKKGSYDFDNMPHYSYQSCTPSTNAEYNLANLMKSAGDYANSSYHYFGTCNTFTWGSDIPGGLSGLGFSNGGNLVSIDYTKMRNELSSGHPVIICGSSCYTCFSDYHIWVCDGYEYQEYNEFDCDILSCKGWGYLAFYMNWGWNGSYNGLYGVNSFNPGGSSSFTANMYSLVDIRP